MKTRLAILNAERELNNQSDLSDMICPLLGVHSRTVTSGTGAKSGSYGERLKEDKRSKNMQSIEVLNLVQQSHFSAILLQFLVWNSQYQRIHFIHMKSFVHALNQNQKSYTIEGGNLYCELRFVVI